MLITRNKKHNSILVTTEANSNAKKKRETLRAHKKSRGIGFAVFAQSAQSTPYASHATSTHKVLANIQRATDGIRWV